MDKITLSYQDYLELLHERDQAREELNMYRSLPIHITRGSVEIRAYTLNRKVTYEFNKFTRSESITIEDITEQKKTSACRISHGWWL